MPEPWELSPEELAAYFSDPVTQQRMRHADRIASRLLCCQTDTAIDDGFVATDDDVVDEVDTPEDSDT